MSRFEYPRLPRRDIVVVLAESQIAAVSEAELLRSDPDFVCNLYSRILHSMEILKGDDDVQMEFEALEHLENPQNHIRSLPIVNLSVQLHRILAAIRCPKSFTLKDLIKPDPDRTELFLGALLNFQLYRQAKMDLVKPVLDEVGHLEQQKQAAEARILELNTELAELEELRERDLPLVQEENFKIKELEKTIDQLNTHQATLRESIKQLKEKGKETDRKISEAEFSLVQSVQENASLRSKIVQSPYKLQRALEEKKLALAEAKDAERAAAQSFQDKTAKLEAYAKACNKISKRSSQMQAIQEQVSSMKSVEKDVKVHKTKLRDEGVVDKSLEVKLVELQSRADHLKDLKRQLEEEKAMRQEEADKEVNNVKFEVEAKRSELEMRQKQVEAMVAESDAINLKRKNVRDEADAKIRELTLKSEEIVAEFDKYSKSISNLLGPSG